MLAAAASLSVTISSRALQMVECDYAQKIHETSVSVLILAVGKVRALCGCIKTDKDQMEAEALFIQNTYGYLAAREIDIAFDLFITSQLDWQAPDFITFSPLFLGKVFASYLRYKSKIKGEVDRKAEKQILLLNDIPGAQKRVEGIKGCMFDCFNHSQNDPPFVERFFNQLVYDFLRRTGRLVLTQDIVTVSKESAEKKYTQDLLQDKLDKEKKRKEGSETDPTAVFNSLHKPPALTMEKSLAIRQYAIDYCLLKYFNDHKGAITTIINNISEKDILLMDKANTKNVK